MKHSDGSSLSTELSPDAFGPDYYSSGVYTTYEEDVRSWVSKVARRINRLLGDVPRPSVLDVGCAHGFLLAELHGKYGMDVRGLEYSRYAIRHAEKTVRKKITEGNILEAKLPVRTFDVVICLDVFEYLSPGEVVRAAKRLVQWSKRFIVFSTIYKNSQHASQRTNPDPFRKAVLTRSEYQNAFLLAGTKFIEAFDASNGGSALIFKKNDTYAQGTNDRINSNDKRKSGNAA